MKWMGRSPIRFIRSLMRFPLEECQKSQDDARYIQ